MQEAEDKANLPELNKERGINPHGDIIERDIPQIDLTSFKERKLEITDSLWNAAKDCGFFQLINHGIPPDQVTRAFYLTENFFDLPKQDKSEFPLLPGTNAGWEYMAQIRPSTGVEDKKESFQITLPRMENLWPKLNGFKAEMQAFERANWELGMQVLSCFALRLGFSEDFFTNAHNRSSRHYQSTLRLLHYLPLEQGEDAAQVWRAGAHTDFDCLTLLHQRPNQAGLQVCPGADASASSWTNVPAKEGVITCNIGDMLMRWSDNELRSTLHRVVMPENKENSKSRYSLAFFCQANTDVIIKSPKETYPPITAGDYLKERVTANSL
jgi:isopenicillin N synthase-like dioxygenase